MAGVAIIGIALLSLAIAMGSGRYAVAAAVVVLLGGVAARAPRVAIGATLLYLAVLGDLRRALIGLVGWQTHDPLLLVGPIVALLLAVPAILSRNQHWSALRLLVTTLLAVMALEMFNPRQGGLAVGLAGALFYVVPILWFFIGRVYGDRATLKTILFRLVPAIALPAACLGIYQAFFGWLPFERRWLTVAGYAALHVGSRVRPISFFTSSSEYESFVVVAAVMAAALGFRRNQRWFLLALVLAVAGFLAGSRTEMVVGSFTVALLWAIVGRSSRTWVPRLVLALAIAGTGGYWILTQLNTVKTGPTASFVQHQTQGLLHPLNSSASTATIHAALMVNGFADGIRTPFGRGLGATTMAASSFGGAEYNTEVDVSNLLVSLGILGGLLYLPIVVSVFWKAFGFWRVSRSALALALMGMLLVTTGSWLDGGQYALSALIWFTIGSLDRLSSKPCP